MAIPKKFLYGGLSIIVLIPTIIFLFLYYGSYSDGNRAEPVLTLLRATAVE